mmetsp:Transcript_1015/g.1672  ORF Transcript_1015/g.1672 Transcript_1015/m.1672 type:complete len:350 (+) Transcript_1015:685-1734(+)
MDACKNGYFSKQDSIKGQTASQTADNVATTIVESGRPDPRKNEQGHTFLMIKRQKKSYSKSDSPVKHQKALPPEVYRTILRSSNHPRELARAQTLGAALFFCMRSCEYSLTPRNEEQKTRPIRPCDITFRLNGTVLPHDHPSLHLSNTVSITFGPQKSEIMEETVTQFKTDDPILCPCILWASVIRRLRSYPKYKPTWPVFMFYDGTRFSHLTSKEYSIDIKAAVDAIGPSILGFTSADVGTHSNRSGGAMMMYLAKKHPYTIMMIGRWSSIAFLRYIEKQVLDFSKGVSKDMIKNNMFFNVPSQPWTDVRNKEFASSSQHHSQQAYRQIFGPSGSSLRDQQLFEMSHL